MEIGAKIIMVNMVTAVTLQIIMRYVFDNPLQWSEELARFSYAWLCYFGVSLATKDKSHLRVTFIVERMPHRVRDMLETSAFIVMLVFFVMVSWSTTEIPKVQGNIRAYSLGVPFYILHMSIIPGFIASAFHTIYHLFFEAKRGKEDQL